MGLFAAIHRRAQRRVSDASREAESKAAARGASNDEVHAAGEKAARKQRVRNLTRGSGGAGGITGG